MTKAELIDQIAKKTNVTKKGVEAVPEVTDRIRTAGAQERWTDKTGRARHV